MMKLTKWTLILGILLLIVINLSASVPLNYHLLTFLHSADEHQIAWSDHAIRPQSTGSVGDSLSKSTSYARRMSTNSDPVSAATSTDDLLAEIGILHSVRHREELGVGFNALRHVAGVEDSLAQTELRTLGAYGLLIEVGAALQRAGESERAMRYTETALSLKPTDYPVIFQLSEQYLADNEFCGLWRVSQLGVRYYDSPAFYYFLGQAYEGLSVWESATEAYTQAIERFPNYEPYERRLRNVQAHANSGAIAQDILEVCDEDPVQ